VSKPKNKYEVLSRSSASVAQRWAGFDVSAPDGEAGVNFSGMSLSDKVALLKRILQRKIHGISFSPYLEGQKPGTEIGESQIRDRLGIIQPYAHWIRSFSCIEGNQETPRIAREMGLKTMVGVGLSDDRDANELEFAGGIEAARGGHADILAIGNEIMLRGDLTDDELIEYIQRAKDAVPGVPVSTVDAYFLFEEHPRVAEACDILLVNCYPFWESCPAGHALRYMKEMYRRAVRVAGGRRVVISETGWPTQGSAFGAAEPSFENALEYFINTYHWAEQDGVEIFYFSAFDEAWKVGDEGDVGAFWGLWDADGNLKYE
jgi:exo-beta-1,3-glucanase (GH17 family)